VSTSIESILEQDTPPESAAPRDLIFLEDHDDDDHARSSHSDFLFETYMQASSVDIVDNLGTTPQKVLSESKRLEELRLGFAEDLAAVSSPYSTYSPTSKPSPQRTSSSRSPVNPFLPSAEEDSPQDTLHALPKKKETKSTSMGVPEKKESDPFRRKSLRAVDRVDYQLPSVRSKLRQGDKHTFELPNPQQPQSQSQRRRSSAFVLPDPDPSWED